MPLFKSSQHISKLNYGGIGGRSDATLTVGLSPGFADRVGIQLGQLGYGTVDNLAFTEMGYLSFYTDTSSGVNLTFSMNRSDWDFPLRIKIGSHEFNVDQSISFSDITNTRTISISSSGISGISDFRDVLINEAMLDFNIQRSNSEWLFQSSAELTRLYKGNQLIFQVGTPAPPITPAPSPSFAGAAYVIETFFDYIKRMTIDHYGTPTLQGISERRELGEGDFQGGFLTKHNRGYVLDDGNNRFRRFSLNSSQRFSYDAFSNHISLSEGSWRGTFLTSATKGYVIENDLDHLYRFNINSEGNITSIDGNTHRVSLPNSVWTAGFLTTLSRGYLIDNDDKTLRRFSLNSSKDLTLDATSNNVSLPSVVNGLGVSWQGAFLVSPTRGWLIGYVREGSVFKNLMRRFGVDTNGIPTVETDSTNDVDLGAGTRYESNAFLTNAIYPEYLIPFPSQLNYIWDGPGNTKDNTYSSSVPHTSGTGILAYIENINTISYLGHPGDNPPPANWQIDESFSDTTTNGFFMYDISAGTEFNNIPDFKFASTLDTEYIAEQEDFHESLRSRIAIIMRNSSGETRHFMLSDATRTALGDYNFPSDTNTYFVGDNIDVAIVDTSNPNIVLS